MDETAGAEAKQGRAVFIFSCDTSDYDRADVVGANYGCFYDTIRVVLLAAVGGELSDYHTLNPVPPCARLLRLNFSRHKYPKLSKE